LGTPIEGFVFNDYCLRCQKVTEQRVELEGKHPYGVCASCGENRALTGLKQVYYKKTDLWVTRFKVDNLPCVVAGRLLDAMKRTH
jgi:hypothetical protein